jgi:hypothetical protein
VRVKHRHLAGAGPRGRPAAPCHDGLISLTEPYTPGNLEGWSEH